MWHEWRWPHWPPRASLAQQFSENESSSSSSSGGGGGGGSSSKRQFPTQNAMRNNKTKDGTKRGSSLSLFLSFPHSNMASIRLASLVMAWQLQHWHHYTHDTTRYDTSCCCCCCCINKDDDGSSKKKKKKKKKKGAHCIATSCWVVVAGDELGNQQLIYQVQTEIHIIMSKTRLRVRGERGGWMGGT